MLFLVLHGMTLIGTALLLSCCFSSARTAAIASYTLVFGSGLAGSLMLSQIVNAGSWYAPLLEVVPSFALYRYV
jgi:hypothetical protein